MILFLTFHSFPFNFQLFFIFSRADQSSNPPTSSQNQEPSGENLPQVDGAYDEDDLDEIEQAVPEDSAPLVHQPGEEQTLQEEAVVPVVDMPGEGSENMLNPEDQLTNQINSPVEGLEITEGTVELISGTTDPDADQAAEIFEVSAQVIVPNDDQASESHSNTAENILERAQDIPMEVSVNSDIHFEVTEVPAETGFLEVVHDNSSSDQTEKKGDINLRSFVKKSCAFLSRKTIKLYIPSYALGVL